jgi:hypothetical protein
MLGKNLGKRFLEPYKYWKQDDRERVRRRKVMIQKQFKGRRRPKSVPLSESLEEQLVRLIEDQANQQEEDEEQYEDWLQSSLHRSVSAMISVVDPAQPFTHFAQFLFQQWIVRQM